MPGVLLVNQSAPIGKAIEQLILLIECSTEKECRGEFAMCPGK